MTDYRKTPAARPWAKELEAGDLLSDAQRLCVDEARLREFGLQLIFGATEAELAAGVLVNAWRVRPLRR